MKKDKVLRKGAIKCKQISKVLVKNGREKKVLE